MEQTAWQVAEKVHLAPSSPSLDLCVWPGDGKGLSCTFIPLTKRCCASNASSILGLWPWQHAAELAVCALQMSLWQIMQLCKSAHEFQLTGGALPKAVVWLQMPAKLQCFDSFSASSSSFLWLQWQCTAPSCVSEAAFSAMCLRDVSCASFVAIFPCHRPFPCHIPNQKFLLLSHACSRKGC